MQGQLSEIDIRSILQLIELGQRTGELYVEAYPSHTTSDRPYPTVALPQAWLVFLLNGQIVYAGTTTGQLGRLRDHLHRYGLETALDTTNASSIEPFNSPEYGHLWELLERHTLTPEQGRTILHNMVCETLFDLLSLHQGTFIFKLSSALSPQLKRFQSGPLVASITQQIQEWKQFYPHIQSPHQCPFVSEQAALEADSLAADIKPLMQWIDGKTSIQQMARYLDCTVVALAKRIYPYTRQGIIQFPHAATLPSKPPELEPWDEARVPRVVCIDDGVAIREAVEHILVEQGYEATSIGNPLRALSLLFQLQPDLILCDIAMPELEGYELCAMLRQASDFRQTPIVMLTGKDGFIDRVKARMAGATDYLTKPFGATELLTLVEKYVGLGNPQRAEPDQLLSDAIQGDPELETGVSPM
ncbi:MAG: response regulator [Cyanobacteria bacterium]|nr:response regulator [Cyanobacteriota bacterium]